MIEWTIAILLIISAGLLIFSIVTTNKAAKAAEERIDLSYISVLKEINEVKQSIRNLELENEIVIKEAGLELSAQEKILKRKVLDLYKRGYSIENIAEETKTDMNEVQMLLAPFTEDGDEGRKVAND